MAGKTEQQFAKLPTSTKLIVGGLVLLLVSAAYYSALHSSITEDIQNEQNRQISLQQKLSKQQKLQREFVQLREELEARKTVDEENLRVLPESAEIATILQDLNRLAELSGLDIQTVRPEGEKKEKFYLRIPVQLSVSGRFHQLSKFFHNISRLERAINIGNIRITRKSQKDDGEVVLSVNVMASTFRRKPGGKS